MHLYANEVNMPIVEKRNTGSVTVAPVFKKVAAHCLPHMLIIVLIPFALIILSLVIRALGAKSASEAIAYYIAFPLALLSPLFITVKQINTLKAAFTRKTKDSHRVILSVFFCSGICIVLLECFFCLSCALYGFYPLEFRAAAYMRDMYASSPAAVILTYTAVFFAYALISLMSTTAYFIGDSSKKKIRFTLSCLVFVGMYMLVLIMFLLAYFCATFLDIKALESIQISSSFFNSSILCSFVTFIIISMLAFPALYFINLKFLQKLSPTRLK